MKKMIFAAAAAFALLFGTMAFAQGPDQQLRNPRNPRSQSTPEQMAQRQTDKMTENLKLTEAQAKQVYALNLESIKSRKANTDNKMDGRKMHIEKLNKILTPEQQAILKQRYEQRKGEMKSYSKDGKKGCDQASKSCCKDGKKGCDQASKSCCKDGKKGCDQASKSCCKDGKKGCDQASKKSCCKGDPNQVVKGEGGCQMGKCTEPHADKSKHKK